MTEQADVRGRDAPRVDPRARRSREALHRALADLLATTPIEQISIRTVTARAGVSYPTFFRNYADLDALLIQLAGTMIEELTALLAGVASGGSAREVAVAIARFGDARRVVLAPLLTGASARLQQGILDKALVSAGDPGAGPTGGLPPALLIPHRVGAVLNILRWWMGEGAGTAMETVVGYLERLAFDLR